jgi:broad specificity phosphatase PhoE
VTTRVMLISPAISAALRQARFDDGTCPPDDSGLRQARSAEFPPGWHGSTARAFASPSARCRETAAALGLDAVPVPDLGGCAMARWRGRTLEELAAAEPEAVAAWLADPSAAPHGGESLLELSGRVAGWLDALASAPGRVVVVAEPDVIRAAVAHALGAPPHAMWRIDVPPLTVTELSGRSVRWNLRAGAPLAAKD